jgi:hypothetical protein
MQKKFIFLLLFLFSGCSIDNFIVFGEINKVNIVQQSKYMKHYRAYFHRTHLHSITHGKKYLYFYNKRSKDFAILLHPKNKYILYSFSHPGSNIKIRSDRKHGYRNMIKVLRHKGYRRTSPHRVGYTTKVSLRRYKKIKTLLIEVKNYQYLQNLYKKAIKTYNAKKIKNIKTKLPKVLIESYYKTYKAKASTEKQFNQLNIIAEKLHLNKSVPSTQETHQKEETQIQTSTSIKENTAEQLYTYYLKKASYYELNNYLSTSEAKSTLTYSQHHTLQKRLNNLEEKQLLQNGTLEELIAAYKKNKNSKYKTKILTQMKELQKAEK